MRARSVGGVALAAMMLLPACAGSDEDLDAGAEMHESTPATTTAPAATAAPPTTSTDDNPDGTDAADRLIDEIVAGTFDTADVTRLVDAGDARHAWLLSDLLRFATDEVVVGTIVDGFEELTGAVLASTYFSAWRDTTDLLLTWDTPAPPEYRRIKGRLFTLVEPRWAPFFDDPGSEIDYRWLNWGGVFIDDRPLGTETPCPTPGCIPSLDDPELVSAADGSWYDDDAIVFGIVEDGDAVALPKNIMEVHEMVNITIGGRRFGIPYCTLCGSAQAFYTDAVPEGVETPVLRTSGLLSRSNKVMYDLVTTSALDTFTGDAVSGPLREAGVTLPQTTVTVSSWGEWKRSYPETRIVAEDGGIGREYSDDPLRGRDDDGPIFPIGDADPRLGAQAPVIGVVLDDGSTIAFSVADLDAVETADGETVTEVDGIEVVRHAGGYRARSDGAPIASHQAFWFAWSQFHPETALWPDHD